MTATTFAGTMAAVTFVSLTGTIEAVEAAASLLSERELARAAQFHRVDDRRRYVLSHAHLRSALAERVRIAPSDIELTWTIHGKPELLGRRQPYFSMSRAGELAAFAFAEAPVGIDIVAMSSGERLMEAAAEFCAPGDLRAVERLPRARRIDALARIWARKEALLKATGEGLTRDPAAFAAWSEEDACMAGGSTGVSGESAWAVADVAAPAGYRAALARSRPHPA